jgi:hypothetical protein
MKAKFVKLGHRPFGVIKRLFLGVVQKLSALRIKGFEFL